MVLILKILNLRHHVHQLSMSISHFPISGTLLYDGVFRIILIKHHDHILILITLGTLLSDTVLEAMIASAVRFLFSPVTILSSTSTSQLVYRRKYTYQLSDHSDPIHKPSGPGQPSQPSWVSLKSPWYTIVVDFFISVALLALELYCHF